MVEKCGRMLSDQPPFPCVTRIEQVQGPKRKIVYIVSFELIAIVLASTLLRWLADSPVATAGITAAASSAIAMGWNYFYNILFESWRASRARAAACCVASMHAVGFEAGLVAMLVPLFAWVLGVDRSRR